MREEGIRSILVNPNIATIQTDARMADKIHFLPVNPDFVTQIIEKERPDAILLGFGGQTALNCGVAISRAGVLSKYGVNVLGTQVKGIEITEDRQLFKDTMTEIGVACPRSKPAYSVDEARSVVKELGYPVIMRVAYTLGGRGGGVAHNARELDEIVQRGLNLSMAHQVLIEEYIGHWKQIEYEVMRDADDNGQIVCNMENVLSMRVHTGDNIVVAPSQTITNREYHMLRSLALKSARRCGIVGECNMQFALEPRSETYRAIEINARLSRSSALASKATGYPIAYIAAKICLGYSLTELKNKVTGVTTAMFEPSLDYCVLKMPRWDTKKFEGASRGIGTAMKSIGEVMAIGRGFEEAVQKASRMLNIRYDGVIRRLVEEDDLEVLKKRLRNPTDQIIFDVVEALMVGIPEEEVSRLSVIDPWFVSKLKNIVDAYRRVETSGREGVDRDPEVLSEAKRLGFSDKQVANAVDIDEDDVRAMRERMGITPKVKAIDTLAAEWPARTNYLYVTYSASADEAKPSEKRKVMVLGAGPYRIGSSVEFDWGTMNMAWALKESGKVDEVVVVNCNPETVSTDFDMSDRLYFEELTAERVLSIYEREKPLGAVLCVGGQTPNDLALELDKKGVRVMGTSADSIERAEDRERFAFLLDKIGIPQPAWGSFRSMKQARQFCDRVGYPVIVRPSHVLSGSAMRVIWGSRELESFLAKAAEVNPNYPVTISKFFEDAKEVEVDAVSDGETTVIGAIMEHVQKAGVHSGDAIMTIPTVSVSGEAKDKIRAYTRAIAKELGVRGPFNIQYLVVKDDVQVIECNLRASRSLPFVSKATGANLIKLAASVILGGSLAGMGDVAEPEQFAVKAPQFSFMQMEGADPTIGVEMRSTGEVACFGATLSEAMSRALIASGLRIPSKGDAGIILADESSDTSGARSMLEGFKSAGIDFVSNPETAASLGGAARAATVDEMLEMVGSGKAALVISLSTNLNKTRRDLYKVRRKAVELQVPFLTTVEEGMAVLLCARSPPKRLG
ncbi:MAG: carbamoyl-phosphate synthase (glutamine-hydrolyzing) large subunit [Nitrososphaerota archaeon]|nr:carbamoyl-phosphate synthase (glutamine-hydrolyzing) large subunit [Nitrososphaerota archaeon]